MSACRACRSRRPSLASLSEAESIGELPDAPRLGMDKVGDRDQQTSVEFCQLVDLAPQFLRPAFVPVGPVVAVQEAGATEPLEKLDCFRLAGVKARGHLVGFPALRHRTQQKQGLELT